MAVQNGMDNLEEEATSLMFLQSPSPTHVRVQVTIVTCKEDVRFSNAEDDLLNLIEVLVRSCLPVRCKNAAVFLQWDHLQTEHVLYRINACRTMESDCFLSKIWFVYFNFASPNNFFPYTVSIV